MESLGSSMYRITSSENKNIWCLTFLVIPYLPHLIVLLFSLELKILYWTQVQRMDTFVLILVSEVMFRVFLFFQDIGYSLIIYYPSGLSFILSVPNSLGFLIMKGHWILHPIEWSRGFCLWFYSCGGLNFIPASLDRRWLYHGS